MVFACRTLLIKLYRESRCVSNVVRYSRPTAILRRHICRESLELEVEKITNYTKFNPLSSLHSPFKVITFVKIIIVNTRL